MIGSCVWFGNVKMGCSVKNPDGFLEVLLSAACQDCQPLCTGELPWVVTMIGSSAGEGPF